MTEEKAAAAAGKAWPKCQHQRELPQALRVAGEVLHEQEPHTEKEARHLQDFHALGSQGRSPRVRRIARDTVERKVSCHERHQQEDESGHCFERDAHGVAVTRLH